MLNRPRIRQLSLGELLDESFRLYRSNFLTFAAIAALVLVPYTLIGFVAQYPFQDRLAEIQNQAGSGANPFGAQTPFEFMGEMAFWYIILVAVSLLYSVIFQPLLEGALAHGISQRYLGRETGVGDSFGAAVRRSPSLISARLIPVLIGVLLGGVIIGGSVLIIFLLVGQSFSEQLDSNSIAAIAGLGLLGFGLLLVVMVAALALLVRILFTSQAVIVENAGAWASLVRSWRLTEGSFWRIVGYMLIVLLLIYVLIALPTFVVSFIASIVGLDLRVQFIINTCANAVLSVIATPFSMITYTLLYFDLRVRKEGFDLEYQARSLLSGNIGVSAFESR